MSDASSYKAAGVDLEAQDEALADIRGIVESTYTKSVVGGFGAFGAMFAPDLEGIEEPVLVSSADGVGTKLAVARLANDFSTVGRDLVNHCVNDILVQGAKPLFFLDYVGAGELAAGPMSQLVGGVAAGCKENGCALMGGETAEMPGFYQKGDYELVGFIVGLADRARLVDTARARDGDLLLGLPSAGLHTNGFSLARKVLLEQQGLSLGDTLPETKRTVREVLLGPHLSYLRSVYPLLAHDGLHGVAHITGGGLTDNLPRVLGDKLRAVIQVGSWEILPDFRWLQEWGGVETDEMFRVFNMGIGLVLVVDPTAAASICERLRTGGQSVQVIGSVQKVGRREKGGVVYDLSRTPSGELD